MVWSGVSQHHPTELVVIAGNLNAVRYSEDILLPHVVPFLPAHPDMTLQHDNATSHTARDFLQDRNVSILPWLAKSPDLNPIEHIWDLLDRRVRARAIPPRNVWEFAGALLEDVVTSHSKNWQIWCRTVTLILNPPSFVQEHIIQFLLVTCLWNLFSLCLSC